MSNIFPDRCARCGVEPLRSSMVSKFNTDTLCLACKADEKLAPGYRHADATEVEAVRHGDYNFPGVGLSAEDRTFLAARRELRKG